MLTRCPELPGPGNTQRFLRGSILNIRRVSRARGSVGGPFPHSVSFLLYLDVTVGHHFRGFQVTCGHSRRNSSDFGRMPVSAASTVSALRFGPDDAKYFCSSSNEITRSLVRSPGKACTTGDLGMTSHSNASRRSRRRVRKSPLIALTLTPAAFRLPANRATISGLIFEICALASSGNLRRRETAPA